MQGCSLSPSLTFSWPSVTRPAAEAKSRVRGEGDHDGTAVMEEVEEERREKGREASTLKLCFN